MKKFTILVINSDKSTGMNFVKCLQLAKKQNLANYNIIGTSTHSIRSMLTHDDLTLNLKNETNNSPKKIISFLEEEHGINVDLIYQTKSAEYMFKISEEREKLPVFLPENKYIELFEDKYMTYFKLKEMGFPVPKTFLLKSPSDVRKALDEIRGEVWVRSRIGQGGRGSFPSSSLEEIISKVNESDGWGEYTIAERLPAIRDINDWGIHLSDEYHPGEMISWIALYHNGKLIASQTRKRLYWEHADLTYSGVTGYTGANMTINRKDTHELSDSIIKHCMDKPHGAMGIDFLVDKEGNLKVTEVQSSRFFTSTYPMALLGLNLPYLYVECFRNNVEASQVKINPCESGMVYIQRFGAESVLVHRDEILKAVNKERL